MVKANKYVLVLMAAMSLLCARHTFASSTSDGTRIEIAERGFSLISPSGWEIVRDHPGITLMLRAPKAPKSNYQRTLQVTVLGGAQPIDEITAREYEEKLVKDFGAATRSDDYRLRNYQFVETEDNQKAILFYTEFSLADVPLMQAHLLVSSKTRHYLVTFTDLAQGFDTEGLAPTLPEAWASMISIKTDTVAGGRFDTMIMLASILLVLGLVVGGVSWFKHRTAADEYKDLAGDLERQANLEDEDHRAASNRKRSKSAMSKAATMADDDELDTRHSHRADDEDDIDFDPGRVS